MNGVISLTAFQRDALQEICGIAAGNAATALSQMLGAKIHMRVPKIILLPIENVKSVFGDPETLVYGTYFRILGEIQGSILITFPRETAINLVDALLPHEPVHSSILTEMDRSALQEAGNIIAGSFVGAIGQVINKTLLISVPHLAFDMAGAIVDFILIELAQIVEQALVLEIEFYNLPKTVQGKFFILPNPGSMEVILKAVGVI